MSSCPGIVLIDLSPQPDVEVRLSIVSATHEFHDDACAGALSKWKAVADAGGFCSFNALPEQSTVALRTVKIAGATRAWTIALTSCDSRCLVVLANMLVDSAFRLTESDELAFELTELQISSADGAEEKVRLDFDQPGLVLSDYHYPDAVRTIEPIVEYHDPASPRNYRRVTVTFLHPLHEQLVDAVSEFVSVWACVCEMGYPASPASLCLGDDVIEDVSVDIFDECTLEVLVRLFRGDESSWNPLLNMLARFRRDIVAIHVY